MSFGQQIPKQVEITKGAIGGVSSDQRCSVKKVLLISKRDCNTGVFQRILRNFQEHLPWKILKLESFLKKYKQGRTRN